MAKKSMKKRIVSLLVSVAILIPLLMVAAYASSPKKSFTFNFNGESTTQYQFALKTELGEPTYDNAGVTISYADFGAGSVDMWLQGPTGKSLSSKTKYINQTGTLTLYYWVDELPTSGLMQVALCCYARAFVQTVGGTFQP